MGKESIYFGDAKLGFGKKEVTGKYTTVDGEDFFLIENYSKMRPFFMTKSSTQQVIQAQKLYYA